MKNFNYIGLNPDKKYFIVSVSSTHTNNVSYQLRDEDGYDLVDTENNMVGYWKTEKDLLKFVKNTKNLKFYKRVYENKDKSWAIADIAELNKCFRKNESYIEYNF